MLRGSYLLCRDPASPLSPGCVPATGEPPATVSRRLGSPVQQPSPAVQPSSQAQQSSPAVQPSSPAQQPSPALPNPAHQLSGAQPSIPAQPTQQPSSLASSAQQSSPAQTAARLTIFWLTSVPEADRLRLAACAKRLTRFWLTSGHVRHNSWHARTLEVNRFLVNFGAGGRQTTPCNSSLLAQRG